MSADSAHRAVAARAFEALAENVRDYAIFLLNADGVITFWGEGARLMKRWTKAQAEGQHLRLLYPPGGSEDGSAESHLVSAAERGEYTGEGRRLRSDGSLFWAGVTLTALRDADGALLGFAKVTRDLTAQRANEAVLRAASDAAEAARAAAESANRAKSGFLATMSHEIRTPVNAILGYQDLLEMELGGPLTAEQRRYLERARASGRHLLVLIDDILDLSRLEADRVTVARSAMRIGAVVDAAISLVGPQARARGIALDDRVSGHAAAVACWADEERVRQVLSNLLSNAVKFTEPGGVVTVSAGTATEPPADVGVSGSGPWCFVRVEDTGRGIAADRLDAVFEPFVQADMSHTRVHGGTGLGLAISRRLARLMGGDLVGRSVLGAGSEFLLWLRAAPSDALADRHPPHGPAPDRPASSGAPHPRAALGETADALLADVDRILHAYVARVRSDPLIPSAHRSTERDIEDHLATFLTDVTQTITAADPTGGEDTSSPREALRDGSDIQRTVADRHGRQRARLGWREVELRREFVILGEELAASVSRHAGRGRAEHDPSSAADALAVVEAFVAAAERVSVAGYQAAQRAAEDSPADEA